MGIWKIIISDYLIVLYESAQKEMTAVIKAQGQNTKVWWIYNFIAISCKFCKPKKAISKLKIVIWELFESDVTDFFQCVWPPEFGDLEVGDW